MWDKIKLDEAIQRNLIFYDDKAKSKEISPKLLTIMQSYAVSSYLGRPIKILKSDDSFFLDWACYYKKIFGCDVDRLDSTIIDYYQQQSCSFAPKKKRIVLLETDLCKYILGNC